MIPVVGSQESQPDDDGESSLLKLSEAPKIEQDPKDTINNLESIATKNQESQLVPEKTLISITPLEDLTNQETTARGRCLLMEKTYRSSLTKQFQEELLKAQKKRLIEDREEDTKVLTNTQQNTSISSKNIP